MYCSFCGGPFIYLGILGQLAHFRCQNCWQEDAMLVEALAECLEYDDEES